jgi:hypothetical protein
MLSHRPLFHSISEKKMVCRMLGLMLESDSNNNKRLIIAGHRWLMPVILATQEAEIRMVVRDQPKQIVHMILSQKTFNIKKGWLSGSSCRAPALPSLSSNSSDKEIIYINSIKWGKK